MHYVVYTTEISEKVYVFTQNGKDNILSEIFSVDLKRLVSISLSQFIVGSSREGCGETTSYHVDRLKKFGEIGGGQYIFPLKVRIFG